MTYQATYEELSMQYREAYQVQLTSPLVVGQLYYAEMYVSLGGRSTFATNNISLYFSESEVPFEVESYGPLHFTPHVTTATVIADTTNWVKISGTFVADTPAEYLLIQNFEDDSLTEHVHSTQYEFNDAYYYIDDILVKETCLSVGSDKTICIGDTTEITAASPSFNGWALASDPATIVSNDAVFTVSPTETTTYLAISACDTFPVTVYVKTAPPDLFFGNDTTICEGNEILLQATDVSGTFEWQDGSSKPFYDVTLEGTYWLKETNECGTSFADIHVTVLPLPVIPYGSVVQICEGDSLVLNLSDTTMRAQYFDSLANVIYTPVIKEPGFYTLIAHNDCGYNGKMISLEVIDCPEKPLAHLQMPNVVTPNGDQDNDLFIPISIGAITSMKTTIFNRWGETLYETNNQAIEWDGSPYPEGVYFWKVEYIDSASKVGEKHGFFHLMK